MEREGREINISDSILILRRRRSCLTCLEKSNKTPLVSGKDFFFWLFLIQIWIKSRRLTTRMSLQLSADPGPEGGSVLMLIRIIL